MTARERRLRQRIDQLLDEREEAVRLCARAQKVADGAIRHCVLCGFPALDRLCHAHSDLADALGELPRARKAKKAA